MGIILQGENISNLWKSLWITMDKSMIIYRMKREWGLSVQ